MSLLVENIPFVSMHRKELEGWKKKPFSSFLSPQETIYVCYSNLESIAKQLKKYKEDKSEFRYLGSPDTMVMASHPAFMSGSWVPKYAKRDGSYNYQFSTGHYHSLFTLLFTDDLIKWSHHQIEIKDIRSAANIIWKMSGVKEHAEFSDMRGFW